MQCIGKVPKTCAANNSHGHVTQHVMRQMSTWWPLVVACLGRLCS